MKIKFLLFFLLTVATSFSQEMGFVSGFIGDKDMNNEALPYANAMIKGTNIGTTSDEFGKYTLKLPPGDYVIQFSFIGYENAEQQVSVKSGETIVINQQLGSGAYTLEDVVIQAVANRERESALLLEQKNAVEIKTSIGAQEMSRKGVTDVANAVTKTTGITKQEGSGNIYVRGLGDRYNATTMNGLPIPSNDPEKKNLDLGIFSTEIVEFVSIDKVYSSRLYGDFAGGNVDIASKDYKGKGFFRIDIGSNANSNAVQESEFNLRKGSNFSGFGTDGIPNNALSSYKFNTLQQDSKMPFGGNFGISAGDSYSVGTNGKLSLFGTVSFSNEFQSIKDGSAASGINPAAVGGPDENSYFGRRFSSYDSKSYATNTTAMVNIGYKINRSNRLSYNSLFINTSEQSVDEYSGRIVDLADDGNGFIRRSTYSANQLFVNQLLGEHTFSDRIGLNWGISHNVVNGDMPDRSTNTFNVNDGVYNINSQSAPNNNRYFQSLTETEDSGSISSSYKFNKNVSDEFAGKITIGYNIRIKSRDFEATQFNFDSANSVVDPENLNLFYNQQNFVDGLFTMATFRGGPQVSNALDPQTYTGDQTIHGIFANAEYQFGTKLTASLGLRAENISQDVAWNTQLDPAGDSNKLEKTAFLPSLTLRYALNEKQNLRFGFSKTYTLPQFKERALFVYEDITEVHVGNPDLYPSDNYNVDLKWEMFPKNEELISFTAFGKYLLNPMNEITISSSTNDISYVNTGDTGFAVGAEIEYRKLILDSEVDNAPKLSAGINASYTYTEQELDSEKVMNENTTSRYQVDFTNSKGQFTGASPLLLNADLTFIKNWKEKDRNISGTIAFTYFSDRVYSIGTTGKGDLVDKAAGTLDFIVKSKLNKNLGIGLSIKNILDPTIDRVQENAGGDVNVLSYSKGINVGLGLNYQF